jgi:hypothetical protein
MSFKSLSSRSTLLGLPMVASFWLLAAVGGAAAFSQIGSENGESDQKQGIVSVPLPPIPSATGAAVPGEAPADATSPSPAAPAPTGPAPSPQVETDAPADAAKPAPPPTSPPATPAAGQATPLAPVAGEAPGTEPAATDASDAAVDGDTSGDETAPAAADIPPAPIFYGDADLPKPVRDLRQRLIEICRSGDIEALRPYLDIGEDGTMVSFGGGQEDPIAFLKSASGDGEGVETLAILLEVLQAGHVRNDVGSDDEIFVWPYFTGVPLDKLTPPQKVELFELVTAGDYQEMLGFGAYNFYRAGISPDGKLQFFVAGD